MKTDSKNLDRWERIFLLGFIGVLLGSAWAGGVVTPWAMAIFAGAILLLLALFAGRIIFSASSELFIPATIWPCLGFLLVGLAQSYAWTDPAGVRQSWSLDVEATRNSLFVIVVLFGAYFLSVNIFRRAKLLWRLANFLIGYGLFFAFISLVLFFAWRQNLLWLRPSATGNSFGTFVNRNHFAGYVELLFPLPVALLVIMREQLAQKLWYTAAAIFMGIALCFSLSRGGMIALGVQLLLLIFCSTQLRAQNTKHSSWLSRLIPALSISGVFILICSGIILIGANTIILRFGDSEDRAEIWANAWRVFTAHPVLGAGLGAFETAFPVYARDNGFDVTDAAHNDYLQILTDTGLVGFLLALIFLVLLARQIRQAMQSDNRFLLALALGSATSIVGLLVHSFFDFNLQLPSHALLFLLHCALCATLAHKATNILPVAVPNTAQRVLSFRKEPI